MRRLFLVILPLALLPALACSVRWVLSDIYFRTAKNPGAPSPVALAAVRTAISLAPWRIEPYKKLARELVVAGKSAHEMDSAYLKALSWSPANAYLWQDYAQMLAYNNRFGDEFEFAIHRAHMLAPASPTLQANNAVLGLRHWFRASKSVQNVWLQSMEYAIHHRPKKFLGNVYASGQMYWFCASPALDLPVAQWCNVLWTIDDPQLVLRGGIKP